MALLVGRIVAIAVVELARESIFELDAQHAVVHARDAVDLDADDAAVAVVARAEARQDEIVARREPHVIRRAVFETDVAAHLELDDESLHLDLTRASEQ